MDLSNNKITELAPVPAPKLLSLVLDSNRIETAEKFGGHAQIVKLSLSQNKLASALGLSGMP